MSNYAWVCFACRAAVRRPGYSDPGYSDRVLCPSCGKPCQCIGYKTPVPPKSKPKAWEQLRERFYEARRARVAQQEQAWVRRKHDMEQQIVRLEALPANAGRSQAIVLLRKRLAAEMALEKARREGDIALFYKLIAGKNKLFTSKNKKEAE